MQNITIYTKPNCGGCLLTKQFLERNGIPFDSIDVSAPENESHLQELKDNEFAGLPVVRVGQTFDNAWSGFWPDRLEELCSQQ